MPAAGRLGDKAQCPSDSHGCPSCAHGVVGPAVAGSSNTFVNGKSALRVGDPGVHSSCCGPNTWNVAKGAPGVYINSIKAHRKGDATTHCGGMGKLIDGSPDVFIGDTGGSSIPPSIPEPDYDQGFVVVHEPSGFPLRDLPYKITKPSGKVVSGKTSPKGHTTRVLSDIVENLVLDVFFSESD